MALPILPIEIIFLIGKVLDSKTFCEFRLISKRYYKSLNASLIIYKQTEYCKNTKRCVLEFAVRYNLRLLDKILPQYISQHPYKILPCIEHANSASLRKIINAMDPKIYGIGIDHFFITIPETIDRNGLLSSKNLPYMLPVAKILVELLSNDDFDTFKIFEKFIGFKEVTKFIIIRGIEAQDVKLLKFLLPRYHKEKQVSMFTNPVFWNFKEFNMDMLEIYAYLLNNKIMSDNDIPVLDILYKGCNPEYIIDKLSKSAKPENIIDDILLAFEISENHEILLKLVGDGILRITKEVKMGPRVLEALLKADAISPGILFFHICELDSPELFKYFMKYNYSFLELIDQFPEYCSGLEILKFLISDGYKFTMDEIKGILNNDAISNHLNQIIHLFLDNKILILGK